MGLSAPGLERGDPDASMFPNSRNGTYPKTVASEIGDVDLAVPRNRMAAAAPGVDLPGTTNTHNTRTLSYTTATGLLAVDLVRQVPAGQALCIHGSLPRIHLHTRRWWQDKQLKHRYEGTAPAPPLPLPERLAHDLFR